MVKVIRYSLTKADYLLRAEVAYVLFMSGKLGFDIANNCYSDIK